MKKTMMMILSSIPVESHPIISSPQSVSNPLNNDTTEIVKVRGLRNGNIRYRQSSTKSCQTLETVSESTLDASDATMSSSESIVINDEKYDDDDDEITTASSTSEEEFKFLDELFEIVTEDKNAEGKVDEICPKSNDDSKPEEEQIIVDSETIATTTQSPAPPITTSNKLPFSTSIINNGNRQTNLKPFDIEENLIRNNRWKNLPSVNIQLLINENQRKNIIRHIESIKSKNPSSTETSTSKEDSSSTSSCNNKVQFGVIQIRNYAQTIGDNPSVSYGTPITLDWEYEEVAPMITVNDYEMGRGHRRTPRQMMLNYYHRRNILQYGYGFTIKQIDVAEKVVNQFKRQREFTKFLLPWSMVEDIVTSAVRKTKRRLHGGTKDVSKVSPNSNVRSDVIRVSNLHRISEPKTTTSPTMTIPVTESGSSNDQQMDNKFHDHELLDL